MRVLSALAVLLLLASCEAHFDWSWNKPSTHGPVKPSGKTVTEDRTVGAFTELRLEGLGKLTFDPTVPAGTVRITADQGVLPSVKTELNGPQLVLTEDQVSGFEAFQLEFRVAPPAKLSSLTLAGLGEIATVEALTTGDLDVILEGLGKINLALVSKAVVLHQRGQGELRVTGTADQVEIHAEGLGKVDAGELKAAQADVENNGLGEVRVFASQSLKVRANGIGAVHFLGHPAQTDVQTEGLTKVSAAD